MAKADKGKSTEAYQNIPEELRALRQWVVFKMPKKIPLITDSNRPAKSNDSKTWSTFDAALKWYESGHCDGVGFMFSPSDPYCGIDLDHCRNAKTGKIEDWALKIIKRVDSYTEISPSGTGVHIIVRSDVPGDRKRKDKFEIYDKGRYFTVTSDIVADCRATVEDRQAQVNEICAEIFGTEDGSQDLDLSSEWAEWAEFKRLEAEKEPQEDKSEPASGSGLAPEDDLIIKKASKGKNGQKFSDLMAGDWEKYPEYQSDQSRADLGFADLCAVHTQDARQIERIMRSSSMRRQKWDRSESPPGYLRSTIAKALKSSGKRPRQMAKDKPPTVTDPEPIPIPRIAEPVFELDEYMPPAGFLRDYVEYMTPITEAPAQYHVFAGLMMLATVIEQRVYFTIADERKCLNLWVVLIGTSGCKKSTSINKAQHILANSGFKDLLFPTQITSEKLIPMLAERSVGTFFWSEWGATMDQWGKAYAQDMMSVFTSLYDGGYFSRWLRSEKYEIMNSSVSLFCGCTPSWLKKTVEQSDVAMGFWPRFLFIPAMRRARYLPNPPKGNADLRAKIEEKLKFTQERFTTEYEDSAEIDFQEVEGIYADWYERVNRAADADVAHPYMASFVVRLSDYVKKVSALIEISSSQDIVVKPETMKYTLKLADWLLSSVRYVMTEVERDELSEIEQRVYDTIAQAGDGGIMHSVVRQKLHYDKRDVELAVESLVDADRIEKTEVGTKGRGRPGKRYTIVT